MGSRWRSVRIENRLSADTPDVFFSIDLGGGVRVSSMMELKCGKINKNFTLSISHYTAGQRDFAHLHHTYLAVWCDSWIMIFNSRYSKDLFKGQSIEWHTSHAIYASKSPCWDTIQQTLINHLS